MDQEKILLNKEKLLRLASNRLEKIYGIALKEVPLLESNKGLWPWQGGVLWECTDEKGEKSPLIQIRKTNGWFFKKLCSQEEILAHELVHFVRFAFKSPLFEEFLAYQTSESFFRRFFGPIFIYPWEATVFGLFTFGIAVIPSLLSWFLVALSLLLGRLFFLQLIFLQAKKTRTLKELLFLRDRQIISLGVKAILRQKRSP